MSPNSSKKGTSSDGSKTEFVQLFRDVTRQSIRDRMHLHMAEQSICSQRLHIKQFARDVENEIYRDSGRQLDASYYSKFNSVLMHIRRIDFLNSIARKVISAKKLVSMTVLFSCLKCGRKAKPYSVFCSGYCIRRYGHPETNENGGKKQSVKTRRPSVLISRLSKPKPQKFPASWNPVVTLERLSNRAIAEILQGGLRANRGEPSEKPAVKLDPSVADMVDSNVYDEEILQSENAKIRREPSEELLIKMEVPSIQLLKPCSITLTLLKDEPTGDDFGSDRNRSNIVQKNPSEFPVQDNPKSIQKRNETTTPKTSLKRRRATVVSDTSLMKIRRKSSIDESKARQIENRIVQVKPKPFPSEITMLDKSKSIPKGNATSVHYKSKLILQRRQTTTVSGTSLIKIRRETTINESKPEKIEHRILQAKPLISKPTVQAKSKPILQRRQTTIFSDTSSIKIRRKSTTVDDIKPRKSRRKSIVDAMKAVKSNKVRSTVYQPPTKTLSEIDENRAKMRQIFKQHLEQRTIEQLQLTPYMNPLTNHEAVVFARDVEQEMFKSFGYGNKYLKKHRELVLSIKNRNNNLILDIIRKAITPQRLVHMTSDELAGPENIEERENIKRRNMELLAQSVADELAHPPVLIRRTDEELIHTRKPINVDRNTSARDLLTAYNDLTGVNLGDSSLYQPARITKRRISLKATVPPKN